MVISDATCAALDHGGGVRFGPHTFAIYSCAPLPPAFSQGKLEQDGPLNTKLKDATARVTKALPIHINADLNVYGDLSNCPAKRSLLQSLAVPRTQQQSTNTVYHLPWFLINAATLEEHCVIGRSSAVESLLVILQRPWCVLEICCAETETVRSVLKFAQVAVKEDPDSYDAAVWLLSHECRSRMALSSLTSHVLPCDATASQCAEKRLCDIYAATTLSRSYNRFWLPLICSCAVYLGLPFSEVVRRIRDDFADEIKEDGLKGWIELYRVLLGRIGDWVA
ncbi:uncharacterized protein BDV14DRAFT_185651 [Aspergillus stella-maris]|uniref:uncharacterized protein n=1 Tax=Aspergillus stella-maris TaxID=1810926 RepID=UPI003CCD23A9